MVRRASPERTCVGCRQRAAVHDLLRFVVVGGEQERRLRPDPIRGLPGRGAHLHPEPMCLELAQRRRAFGRALRLTGVVDTEELAEYIRESTATSGHPAGRGSHSKVGRRT
ncbi:YlxR family protein [Micromonospora sp. NBC_01813]|uniref:YlxR family protein n=1 Tax=Micromonospora sp. NBC_01813 TaxID=2975988 RepID=UPI002DD7F1D5|nr:YlxR family protein [Micromonospora sp. NBC_01813]